MSRMIEAQPLTTAGFAPYGDVIEVDGAPDKIINQGMCGRHHDRARLDFGNGRAGISLFDAKARNFPYQLEMVERHPDGSQAFIPLSGIPMLVIVADDVSGEPDNLKAFLSGPGQAVNLLRGVWHGVLAPIGSEGQYIVVDRIGEGPNLQEHWFAKPYTVTKATA